MIYMYIQKQNKQHLLNKIRSGGRLVDKKPDYKSRDHMIGPSLPQSFG